MILRLRLCCFILLLLFIPAAGDYPSLMAAENTLFPGWEAEARLVPGLLLTRTQGFDLKAQAGLRAELQTACELFRYNENLGSLRLGGGLQWTGASSLDGGYSYAGYVSSYLAVLLGWEKKLKSDLSWRLHSGLLGEWVRYYNTQNLVFFPTLRVEPGVDFSAVVLHGQTWPVNFYASLPVEWSFRRDTDLSLGFGLSLGAAVKLGGVK